MAPWVPSPPMAVPEPFLAARDLHRPEVLGQQGYARDSPMNLKSKRVPCSEDILALASQTGIFPVPSLGRCGEPGDPGSGTQSSQPAGVPCATSAKLRLVQKTHRRPWENGEGVSQGGDVETGTLAHCPAAFGGGLTVSGRAGAFPLCDPAPRLGRSPGQWFAERGPRRAASAPPGARWEGARSPGSPGLRLGSSGVGRLPGREP